MKIIFNTCVKDHSYSILERFNHMRKEEKLCDFIIRAGEENLKVHRDILAASSDYFFAMFSHDTVEKSKGIVEMEQVPMSAVRKCVDYIYTGEFETTIEELDEFLFVVNIMQLRMVRQNLPSLLESCLNPESFMTIRYVALKYGLQELNSKCNVYAFGNLDLLADTGCISLFEYEYMSFLLSSELLYGYGFDEDAKLAIAIEWIKADIENRKDKLIPLCNLLDLEEISISCRKYLMETEEIWSNSVEFKEIASWPVHDVINVESRKPSFRRFDAPNAILQFDQYCDSGQIYNLATNSMRSKRLEFDQSPIKREDTFVTVCAGTKIYLLLYNSSFYALDLVTCVWNEKIEMIYDHGSYLKALFHDGNIYACGSGTMEKYSIANDEWETIDISDKRLVDCELITYKAHLLTIGGNIDGPISDVNVLDTDAITWSIFPSLTIARATPAAATINNDIYVVGGFVLDGPLYEAEYFDASTHSWSILSQTNHLHDYCRLFAIRNVLYIVGGVIGQESTEIYDICTKQWMDLGLLNTEYEGCDSVILFKSQLDLLLG